MSDIPFPTKLNVVSKYAIKYGDNLYLTKSSFTFSKKDWYTDKISEIPNDMLFDSYNEARDWLYSIGFHHRLVRDYLSLEIVRKLEDQNNEKET